MFLVVAVGVQPQAPAEARFPCVTGFPKCSNDTPCPFHDEWKIIRGKLVAMLEGETIQKLMEDAKSGKRVPFLNPEYFKEFKTSS